MPILILSCTNKAFLFSANGTQFKAEGALWAAPPRQRLLPRNLDDRIGS
jgi:hypothetical protein